MNPQEIEILKKAGITAGPDDPRVQVLRSSILNIQVCSALPIEEALEALRISHPAGTTGNWQIPDYNTDEYKQYAPVQCANDPKKFHYVFFC